MMSKIDFADDSPAYTCYQHACITLNMSDRLRFIRFPSEIIDVIRQAIISSWPRGLNKEKQDVDCHEFKLHGNPWLGQGDEAVPCRVLMINILSVLHNHVSFNDYDKLRLICAPKELIPVVQQTLGLANIQREEWRDGGLAYQFKLRGSPWIGHGDEAVTSRLILLSLLDCFTAFGWRLHASIDISQGHEGRDTDSWFLRRDIQ